MATLDGVERGGFLIDRLPTTTRLTSPAALLGLALATACAIAALPADWTAPAKSKALLALQPGQRAAAVARDRTEHATLWVRAHWQSTARLSEAERELDRLGRENARLIAERDALRSQLLAASTTPDDQRRLLRARAVPAQVLGAQARAYLARNHLLDAGTQEGVQPGALVLDQPPLIDAGADVGLNPGQLVVAGRRVLGKIVEAGSHTSTVGGITEPGYRDLVRIGGPDGPQGILEGSGGGLARVRLVEVTSPVAEGDPVYSSAGEGVLELPPLCGRVAGLSRPVGAAHWEISVEPAASTNLPRRVAVLQVEPNPERIAEQSAFRRDRAMKE